MRDAGKTPQSGHNGGELVPNLMHFARVLRVAGLPVGPGKVLDAIRAVQAVGVTDRDDFYWTLHAVFVNRHPQRVVFDQAFHVFWRNPRILERVMSMILPSLQLPETASTQELSRRLVEALHPGDASRRLEPSETLELELDATMTWSDREVLQSKDFEKMSVEEMALAKNLIGKLQLPIGQAPTRRFQPHPHGERIDLRASLRAALRSGPGTIPLLRKRRRERPPPLVILCDISGSMSRYSRMLLHFAHAVARDRLRVFSFVFGTRLTNITRQLREKDVDVALDRVAEAVQDWSGGTRIGCCLHDFNRLWSRRVLGQGAMILLISDGLDRDAGQGLDREMERLHKSCRRLIWLNPLLRYEGFEPRSLGMQAILPHVDDFRTVHNLQSLTELSAALSHPEPRRSERVMRW